MSKTSRRNHLLTLSSPGSHKTREVFLLQKKLGTNFLANLLQLLEKSDECLLEVEGPSSNFTSEINLLMLGGNKKITHTYTNLQLNASVQKM